LIWDLVVLFLVADAQTEKSHQTDSSSQTSKSVSLSTLLNVIDGVGSHHSPCVDLKKEIGHITTRCTLSERIYDQSLSKMTNTKSGKCSLRSPNLSVSRETERSLTKQGENRHYKLHSDL